MFLSLYCCRWCLFELTNPPPLLPSAGGQNSGGGCHRSTVEGGETAHSRQWLPWPCQERWDYKSTKPPEAQTQLPVHQLVLCVNPNMCLTSSFFISANISFFFLSPSLSPNVMSPISCLLNLTNTSLCFCLCRQPMCRSSVPTPRTLRRCGRCSTSRLCIWATMPRVWAWGMLQALWGLLPPSGPSVRWRNGGRGRRRRGEIEVNVT